MELNGGAASYRLDLTSGVPFYRQVQQRLEEALAAGTWRPGQRFPNESELCTAFGVSRVTVRQALARLVDRGLLVRERGRGTFVRDPSLVAGGLRAVASEIVPVGGEGTGLRLLDREVVPAPAADARLLDVAEASALLRLRRLHTVDHRPSGLQIQLLPLTRFPGLETVELEGNGLHGILRQRYSLVPLDATETVTATAVDADSAALIEGAVGAPALRLERLTFDAAGPFEHTVSLLRGDRHQLRIRLHHSTRDGRTD